MKVIAVTNGGFIVEMQESEMAKLVGLENTYSGSYEKLKIKQGSELDVHAAWDFMKHAEGIEKYKADTVRDLKMQITKLESRKAPKFIKETPCKN